VVGKGKKSIRLSILKSVGLAAKTFHEGGGSHTYPLTMTAEVASIPSSKLTKLDP